jgi:septal ring factor EnvC (AmiA/AmiB activator)
VNFASGSLDLRQKFLNFPAHGLAKLAHGGHVLHRMKNTIGLGILAVVAIGLAITLFITKKNATEQNTKAQDQILSLSNSWENTNIKLTDQIKVNTALEKDKAALTQEKADLTTELNSTKTTLASTEKSLVSTKEEVAKRDARITELESANAELDKQAESLSQSITNLTELIATTRQKLATTEGDKAFLEKELQRLMAEKAELERQFNDIAVLRAQVAKLKEELNISRRLEWIRKGLIASSSQKGAQGLLQSGPGAAPAPTSQTSTSRFDLNVEVQSDGSVKVIPPPSTNVPALPK